MITLQPAVVSFTLQIGWHIFAMWNLYIDTTRGSASLSETDTNLPW